MLKTARHEEIMRFLQRKQCANVQEICDEIYASPATVRRDLKMLESQGFVRLFYGGVMLTRNDERDVPLSIREYESKKKKILIARKAADMIPGGARVFLDASSTAMYIANYIDISKDITVFTNGIKTATILCERNISAYCIGGMIGRLSLVTTGVFAAQNIGMVNADMAFFSSQGLDKNGAITDNSEAETQLRRLMIEHSKKSWFLCDSAKIGKQFLFTVCNASQVDGVISDGDLSLLPDVNHIKVQ
ncbi:MAG: DeoR/GlpR transcriptional regulator [Clostridia bacterium]|nr:DeoR/GlpR transcriptional regulator [Clostridia bacterium]